MLSIVSNVFSNMIHADQNIRTLVEIQSLLAHEQDTDSCFLAANLPADFIYVAQ